MSENYASREEFDQVAEQLSEAVCAIERVDYNSVATSEDLRTLLDARDELRDVWRHHRTDTQSTVRRERDAVSTEGDCTDE